MELDIYVGSLTRCYTRDWDDAWSRPHTRFFRLLITDLRMLRKRPNRSSPTSAVDCALLSPAPYFPDRNPDEFVWKHLKADTVGRTSIISFDFNTKVKSSMLSLQRNPEELRSSFQKPSLRYSQIRGINVYVSDSSVSGLVGEGDDSPEPPVWATGSAKCRRPRRRRQESIKV